jgi:hypothetical protein
MCNFSDRHPSAIGCERAIKVTLGDKHITDLAAANREVAQWRKTSCMSGSNSRGNLHPCAMGR